MSTWGVARILGKVLLAALALPSLLGFCTWAYLTAGYSWYFLSQGGPDAAPLVLLGTGALVGPALSLLPAASWVRHLFSASADTPREPLSGSRRLIAIVVDALWALAPAAWPALFLTVGLVNLLSTRLPLAVRLGEEGIAQQVALFAPLALSYAVLWTAWVRRIIRRNRGTAMPPSPGRMLVDRSASRPRRTAIITVSVLLVLTAAMPIVQLVLMFGVRY